MKRSFQAGYTLIELTVFMASGILLASCLLAFLNSLTGQMPPDVGPPEVKTAQK